MARRNELAEGIDAGSRIASNVNSTLDNQDRMQLQRDLEAEQIQQAKDAQAALFDQENSSQARTIAAQQQMEQDRLAGQGQLQTQGEAARMADEQQLAKDRLANELALQQAIAERTDQHASHALADQHQQYFDTLDQLQANLTTAQKSGDPDAIASAQRRFASWQQMGPGIFDTAKKNQGITYTIDPETGAMKISGTVNSPDDLAKVKASLLPTDQTTNPISAQLDKAIADKQKAIGLNEVANPTGAATFWDHVPGVGGYKSQRDQLEADLSALQQQRASLNPTSAAPAAAVPGVDANSDPLSGDPGMPQASPQLGVPAPTPPTQLGMPPSPTTQLGPQVPSPNQTGATALQSAINPTYPEGTVLVNPKTGAKVRKQGGKWIPAP